MYACDFMANAMQTFSFIHCFTVLEGGGAWGTALAAHAARMGHNTVLWARETEVVASVNGSEKENTTFLKVGLPDDSCAVHCHRK